MKPYQRLWNLARSEDREAAKELLILAKRHGDLLSQTLAHLVCSAARERQQQYAARIHATLDQARHAMNQCVRLSCASTSENQQRRIAMSHCALLLFIKPFRDTVGQLRHLGNLHVGGFQSFYGWLRIC